MSKPDGRLACLGNGEGAKFRCWWLELAGATWDVSVAGTKVLATAQSDPNAQMIIRTKLKRQQNVLRYGVSRQKRSPRQIINDR